MRGPDGTVRMGFGMPGRGGGFRLMMGGGPLRRLSEPESEASLGSGLSSPDYGESRMWIVSEGRDESWM